MQHPPDSGIWRSNLEALSARDAPLASRLASAVPSEEVSFAESRTGRQIPRLRTTHGSLPLHSLYDPEKEARRLAETVSGSGFLVCLGIGGAYQAAALLSDPELSGLFLVDRDLGLLRSIMARIDMRRIIEDPRTVLLLDETPRSIAERLLSFWIPGLCGSLRTLPLRPRLERDGGYFRDVGDAIRTAVDGAAADCSIQSRFGKRWFSNIARNLYSASSASPLPALGRETYVVGAGPSLESQIPVIRSRSPSVSLVAADTAFPCLAAANLEPDLVVSIDCQHYSVFHFLKGFPPSSVLALDLSSPPILSRVTGRRGFFSGGHPFSRFAARRGFPFPEADTSGGNVSHAAVSLAIALGAAEIRLFGVDFSYPEGKSYARGTYLYDYFLARSGRLFPVSEGFAGLVFDREGLARDTQEGFPRYSTPQLAGYREKFEAAARGLPARIRQEPGQGLRLSLPSGIVPERAVPSRVSSTAPAAPDPRRFLLTYLDLLRSLPMPSIASPAGLAAFPAGIRDVWMTILPLCAWQRARTPSETHPSALLAAARSIAVSVVSGVLGIDDGRVAHE
jgi:hypothetical protein